MWAGELTLESSARAHSSLTRTRLQGAAVSRLCVKSLRRWDSLSKGLEEGLALSKCSGNVTAAAVDCFLAFPYLDQEPAVVKTEQSVVMSSAERVCASHLV